ncbi:hypothetical protein [Massilia sp. CCM 8734]|uniref:hypothetical protein n=1 Tax=Massilia sp. CCM 8734 TaxID=2609283 RepID=UPI001422B6FE|nr:hypothetical protein [Massilia sp. CCM 8734]NHZ94625.1 hypothetical protein [Massilia sp. CCM 8734]
MSALTDPELLELAAKAAGMEVQRSRFEDPINRDFLMNGSSPRNYGQRSFPWNPLTDDGDALRLAVKLGLYLEIDRPNTRASALPEQDDMEFSREPFGTDPCAATRRAIVRAAAAIGEAM